MQPELGLVVTTGFSKLKVPLGLLMGAFYLMGRMWRPLLQQWHLLSADTIQNVVECLIWAQGALCLLQMCQSSCEM